MTDCNRGNRLSETDPWDDVAEARAQRGPLVARGVRSAWARWFAPGPVAGSERPPGPRVGPAVLLPLAAGYFLSYLFRNVNGVFAGSIMRELGIGADALGQMTSLYFLVFAAAQLPVGVLLDRFGPRRVQFVLLLIASCGAVVTSVGAGFATLCVGRALIGLGTAGSLVAGLKASAAWFPRERLAVLNGAFIMCGGVGALAATWPVELGLLVTDWRGLSMGLAVLAGLVAVAIWAFVPEPDVELAGGGVAGADGPVSSLRDVMRDPLFLAFSPLSASCFGAVLAVQGLWAGPWLTDVDGLTHAEVASDLAGMAAVLIAAAPCWGWLTQWLRPRVSLPVAAAGAAVLLMAVEVLVVLHTALPPIVPWGLFALFGGMSVLSYSVLAEHFPRAAIGRANGALNVAHIGCSFVVQLGIGQIVAQWVPEGGRYPAAAYEAGLALPLGLQMAALMWFGWQLRRRWRERAGGRAGVSSSHDAC